MYVVYKCSIAFISIYWGYSPIQEVIQIDVEFFLSHSFQHYITETPYVGLIIYISSGSPSSFGNPFDGNVWYVIYFFFIFFNVHDTT